MAINLAVEAVHSVGYFYFFSVYCTHFPRLRHKRPKTKIESHVTTLRSFELDLFGGEMPIGNSNSYRKVT